MRNLGPVHVQAPASGIHEVLVFSPEHDGSWADLDDRDAGLVMAALRDRVEEHARTPNVRYTQAIVNHGREAGASLSHPHGQLLGMPFVPGEILDEERAFGRFEGGCILCATVEAEVADGSRVVHDDDRVVIVCPFWAGSPYELLVIPRTHEAHLQASAPADLAAVGRAVRDVARQPAHAARRRRLQPRVPHRAAPPRRPVPLARPHLAEAGRRSPASSAAPAC